VGSLRTAIVTVSTLRAGGEGEDESGDRLAELVARLGGEIAGRELVPDDFEVIAGRLRHWADDIGCALVLTSGGTGFAPTDVTPEATRGVIEREAPGIAEAMRFVSREHSRHWMLSRGVAGIRGSALIVNFPGSPRSIPEMGEAIADSLPHALALLAGEHPAHD
jgi:molybdopterin adenylyltransferase